MESCCAILLFLTGLHKVANFIMSFSMQIAKTLLELKKLATGYYIGSIFLSVAFFILKITNGLCNIFFHMEGECGLDRVSFFSQICRIFTWLLLTLFCKLFGNVCALNFPYKTKVMCKLFRGNTKLWCSLQ